MATEGRWLGRGGYGLKRGMLLAFVVVAAGLVGMVLGLQPYFAIPFAVPVGAALALWFGARTSQRAIGLKAGWPVYVVLTFWALTVNVPAFMSFDQTGFTRDNGLFNAQSIARIGLFCVSTFLAACYWVLWGQDESMRGKGQPVAGARLLSALYLWYLVQAPLVTSGLSMALAVFRVSEWIVAFGLLGLTFRIQNACGKSLFEDRLRLIVPMLFFLLASVFLLLLLAPSQAYQVSKVTGTARLGGLFTHPNLLALVATILFAYFTAYWHGWKRFIMVILCVGVVGLTYSRGGFVAFALVALLGLLIFVRHAAVLLLLLLVFALAGLLVAHVPSVVDDAVGFLQRGNETQSLTELSERTAVWEAAKNLIAQSPWLGDGFVSGPKLLGDEMIRARLSHNFAAPHAHNEFLQAQVSGGVIASILTLAIHLRVIFLMLFRLRFEPRSAFVLWSIVISVLVWGLLTPSLSYLLSLPGILLGWALLTLEDLCRETS
jgi:O-antigen ligase